MHFSAANVVVECKNYSRPLANPEYDQIAGRFSPSRGKFGLLVYRGYTDKAAVWKSCRDTAGDARGFVIPLDDDDLREIVDEQVNAVDPLQFGLLHKLFDRLTS
jgi:hypothetical protein